MAKNLNFTCLVLVLAFLATCNARNPPIHGTHSKTQPKSFDLQELLTDVPTNYTHVCDESRFAKYNLNMGELLFCDRTLPFEVRAKDLVARMTLAEKVQQMGNHAKGVARLGLPKYQWWSEALHGISNSGPGVFFDDVVPGATSFPTVILTTASFNESLWKKIGQAVSTEGRAMFNLGRAGLTFWSPNINVARDPRWGRIMETPGEDPFAVGRYGTNYVRGLQDVEGTEDFQDLNARPLRVSTCCKHYAAYDLENWKGVDRRTFDARVTAQDMKETFLRPFEMCVREGDSSSAMCSFNKINGIPACADRGLLKDVIRGEWDLHGYIVSDCDSIKTIVEDQKWLDDTPEDAAAQVLKAGLDLDCGYYYNGSLQNAVWKGVVNEAEIDRSLRYLYVVLMRLGYFDGSEFSSLSKEHLCTEDHFELAAEAAREGIVLLKNDNSTLPLKSDNISKIALIGPHANVTRQMLGNYAGIPCRYVSPLDAFSEVGEVVYETGCLDVACNNETYIFSAMRAAANANATVLVVGLDLSVEREGVDRLNLLLPGYQTQLINQVAEISAGPVILVVLSGGVVDISFAQNNPKIKAILWAGYPGQEGGRAIADVVYGKYNPGGRVPLTWYQSDYTKSLPMTSMQFRPDDSLGYPGRTYKFFNGTTVYPFGYGLSYTKFKYNPIFSDKSLKIKLNKTQHCHRLKYSDDVSDQPSCPGVSVDDLPCSYEFGLNLEVENVGDMDGSEVVMIYSSPPQGLVGAPIKQLIGFKRVFIPAGGKETLTFVFNACKTLNLIDDTAYNLLPSGSHKIMVGDGEIISFVNVRLEHDE